jgi:high-affinity Fe2+/Pb2+ permease
LAALAPDTRKDPVMRGHGAHMWICGAMIVGGLVVVLATGNAAAFLLVIGCILMMVVMMAMMGGMAGHDHRQDHD